MEPEVIDFGLVFGPQETSFTVRSSGSAFGGFWSSIVGPDALNCALLNEDDVSYTLDPKIAHHEVLLQIQEGPVKLRVISSNDYSAANTAVTLLGEGPNSDLKITPNPYNFGDVMIGCEQTEGDR